MDKLLSGRQVLVVEDEMLISMMIEGMLSDLGCKAVSTAATVGKALALIDARDFDFVMLDMNLNGDTSHPVAEVLAARGVPFLYSTGNSILHNLKGGYGNLPVLKKPFKYDDVVDACTRLLSRAN